MHRTTRSYHIDWLTPLLACVLASIGLLFIYSTTHTLEHPFSVFFKKQAYGIAGGILVYWVFCLINDVTLRRWGYVGYIAVIALLILTLIKGSIGMGAQRWMSIGGVKFQPSELAKLLFPAFFVTYLRESLHRDATLLKQSTHIPFGTFVPVVGILFSSGLLIIKQPDLGTGLLLLMAGMIMLWFAGITRRFFIIGACITLIATPALWRVLKPYQRKRIEIFLGGGQSHKERYQTEQALIAIGSGGITGKGLMQGTQNRLAFLPERRNDFIFAVICEEWGLLGALLLLFLYALLFTRLLLRINLINSFSQQLVAIGLLAHILLATLINMGMASNLLPVVGISLPLVSYGLTYLLITFASLGWISGIVMRNQ